ncbi:MAG: hypothetical protein WBZ48_04090 [Bacteroidota bacterium]
MTVRDVDDVTAHRASNLLLVDIMKLFFDIPKAKKKDEGKYEKQFERQHKEGNTKRYNG